MILCAMSKTRNKKIKLNNHRYIQINDECVSSLNVFAFLAILINKNQIGLFNEMIKIF